MGQVFTRPALISLCAAHALRRSRPAPHKPCAELNLRRIYLAPIVPFPFCSCTRFFSAPPLYSALTLLRSFQHSHAPITPSVPFLQRDNPPP